MLCVLYCLESGVFMLIASRSTPFMFDKAGEFSGCCEYKVAARSPEMERQGGIYQRAPLKPLCVG